MVMTMTITVNISSPRAKTSDDGGLRTGYDGTVIAYMTILYSKKAKASLKRA
jgi:hypothetical protein